MVYDISRKQHAGNDSTQVVAQNEPRMPHTYLCPVDRWSQVMDTLFRNDLQTMKKLGVLWPWKTVTNPIYGVHCLEITPDFSSTSSHRWTDRLRPAFSKFQKVQGAIILKMSPFINHMNIYKNISSVLHKPIFVNMGVSENKVNPSNSNHIVGMMMNHAVAEFRARGKKTYSHPSTSININQCQPTPNIEAVVHPSISLWIINLLALSNRGIILNILQ